MPETVARHACRGLLVLFALTVLANAALAEEQYRIYENERFGTLVHIPPRFTMQDESIFGESAAFGGTDWEGSIHVYAANGDVGDTIADGLARLVEFFRQDGIEITYQATREDWFVLSGIVEDQIVYTRAKIRDDCFPVVFHHVTFEYPRRDKKRWDPIVRNSGSSLDGDCDY